MLLFKKKLVPVENWTEITWLIENAWEVVSEDSELVELSLEM